MTRHIPQLCELCGAPLTARRNCTRCPAPGDRWRPDPLVEWRERLRPWIRGQRWVVHG